MKIQHQNPRKQISDAVKSSAKKMLWFSIIILLFSTIIASGRWWIMQNVVDDNSYECLLSMLEEEPEDISKIVYTEKIPERLQKKIDHETNPYKEVVVYSNQDMKSSISIYKTPDGWGIKIAKEKSSLVDYISMYRNGDDIIIYGTACSSNRRLERYAIDTKTGEVDYCVLDNGYFDLFGTDMEESCVISSCNESILVQHENEFALYRLGIQIGEAVEFPGENIMVHTREWYQDSKGDLFQLYYCGTEVNPWIKFVKIDCGVTSIYRKYYDTAIFVESVTESCMIFQPYYKGDEPYVAFTHQNLQELYGRNSGELGDGAPIEEVDFTTEAIKISDECAEYISFVRYDKKWYLRTVYLDDGQRLVYKEKQIWGIKNSLTVFLSDEEVAMFENRKITPEEVEMVVSELKAIYEKYE